MKCNSYNLLPLAVVTHVYGGPYIILWVTLNSATDNNNSVLVWDMIITLIQCPYRLIIIIWLIVLLVMCVCTPIAILLTLEDYIFMYI